MKFSPLSVCQNLFLTAGAKMGAYGFEKWDKKCQNQAFCVKVSGMRDSEL
jgi:hypothetical protein